VAGNKLAARRSQADTAAEGFAGSNLIGQDSALGITGDPNARLFQALKHYGSYNLRELRANYLYSAVGSDETSRKAAGLMAYSTAARSSTRPPTRFSTCQARRTCPATTAPRIRCPTAIQPAPHNGGLDMVADWDDSAALSRPRRDMRRWDGDGRLRGYDSAGQPWYWSISAWQYASP